MLTTDQNYRTLKCRIENSDFDFKLFQTIKGKSKKEVNGKPSNYNCFYTVDFSECEKNEFEKKLIRVDRVCPAVKTITV